MAVPIAVIIRFSGDPDDLLELHPHIEAVGMGAPDQIERMRIEKLGWD